ncbi:flagellar basal body P-ring formation chaperone FlgA [Trinickia dinghuensis]|nr:flagellar basal body P-ring formation chaperone FlgA [Trinickia dinghuensis]
MSVSAASDPARRKALRALGRRHVRVVRAAAGLLLACTLLPFGAAHAQTVGANGQIYIPGPGEAHAAQPASTMITIPGRGESQAAADAGASSSNGMIVIPGPGETRAGAGAAAVAHTAYTTYAPQAPRPSIATEAAASRTMPVVVTAPQRVVRAAPPIAAEQPANGRFNVASVNVPSHPAVQAAQMPAPAAAAALAPASNAPAGDEDGETIRNAALAYLQQQTLGLPGKIKITVAPTFPRGLATCTTLEPFMPTGARLWGMTTVGVRCAGAKPWTLYLRARVAIDSTYYLAARQIEPGTMLTAQDLLARDGDLSNLPRAIITDPSQAVGSTALVRISAGMPLRQDLLKSASAVTIGQTVRVVAQGQGFQISSEGSVMNNASPGQQVRVKMAGGQIISGIVVDGATVQVQM